MFGMIYYFICAFVYIISIPLLLLSSLKSKHRHSIPARFFPKLSFHTNPSFWFHACSYGEIKSLEPIIKAMPKEPILITTITQTGFELANLTYKDYSYIQVRFLPFEIFVPFFRHNLKSLKTLIVTEAELWYLVFKTAKSMGAKTMLINARISTKSFPKYKKFSWFYTKIFKQIDEIFSQQETDMPRLKALGASKITTFGNLKLLSRPNITTKYQKNPKLTIIAASTHCGEEENIIQAFIELKKSFEKSWLIIVPRHPERFDEVKKIIHQSLLDTPYSYGIFSKDALQKECDILLIDALGELNNLYAIGDIVILGGSFVKVGGHNPLEPAFFHTKLISGPYIFNQEALFLAIQGYKIIQADQLSQTLKNFQSLPDSKITNQENKLQELIATITTTKEK